MKWWTKPKQREREKVCEIMTEDKEENGRMGVRVRASGAQKVGCRKGMRRHRSVNLARC